MKKLLVLLGPTGVGKTELSLSLAKHYDCAIISADSRQLFKGLEVGTAAATEEQRAEVKHYLVGHLDVTDYYSASEFESDALQILENEFLQKDIAIATGGSMMYVDALCDGIDKVPDIDETLRQEVYEQYEREGLEAMQGRLKILDPVFYDQVDLKNHKRVIHAIEVCMMTGKPYSSFRSGKKKERPFEIIKIGLMRDRPELYERINERVDQMIDQGMLDEANHFYPQRELNSLNTVGYKELFKYLDGEWTLDFAKEKIKQSTRIYSRKQMTWFKRDTEIHWMNRSEMSEDEILDKIKELVR